MLALDGAQLPAVSSRPPRQRGVLADLPFINTGAGDDIVIDIAQPDDPAFLVTLDTGAADTVLSRRLARALGVSVRRVKTSPYRRNTVTGVPLKFWVTTQGGGSDSYFDHALLGGEFMKHFVVDIGVVRRRKLGI